MTRRGVGAGTLHALRQVKHRAFLTRRAASRVARRGIDTGYRAYDRALPYRFDPEQHRDRYGSYPRLYFLHRSAPQRERIQERVPRRIFAFWTGDNALSANRERCLREMRAMHDGLEIVLITPQNLREWVVDGAPIHPAYRHLSLIHRSDYLRAYFMAHHGGGYADIKTPTHSWSRAHPLRLRVDAGAGPPAGLLPRGTRPAPRWRVG